MALADVRSTLTTILNRRDLTPAIGNSFITLGQTRIQRSLRIPSMERVYQVLVPLGASVNSVPLPDDLLQIIDVMVDGVSLDHKGLRDLTRHRWELNPNYPGFPQLPATVGSSLPLVRPKAFARVGATIQMAPPLFGPGEFLMTYHGAFGQLVNDTDENELTRSCPDLLTYAALTYAGDWTRNDQLETWTGTYTAMLAEIQDSANQLDATGGSMVVRAPHGDY